ncbi:MAG: hypothetical protein K2Q15_11035, partial [Burkholderiales bacterium]|nr:hypothetical protein [Burkholderiales bacterium]
MICAEWQSMHLCKAFDYFFDWLFKLNIRRLFNILLAMLLPSFSFALTIGEVTSFIEPEKEAVSIDVKNKTERAVLINVSV